MSRKNMRKGMCFLIPGMVGIGVFKLIPFARVVYNSFHSMIGTQNVGFSNYMEVFQNEAFRLATVNTILFIMIVMPLLLIISLVIAAILTHLKRLGRWLQKFFLFPMAVPVVSVALFWHALFTDQGFLNSLFMWMGLQPVSWMNSRWAFIILAGTFLWKNLGYDILLWMIGIHMIPREIYEAAMMDGAGYIKSFFRITVPNLKPSFFVIIVLSLMNVFKVYREAFLVAGNYPHESIYMIQHLLSNWFRELSIDKLSAASVIYAIMISAVVVIFWKCLEGRKHKE